MPQRYLKNQSLQKLIPDFSSGKSSPAKKQLLLQERRIKNCFKLVFFFFPFYGPPDKWHSETRAAKGGWVGFVGWFFLLFFFLFSFFFGFFFPVNIFVRESMRQDVEMHVCLANKPRVCKASALKLSELQEKSRDASFCTRCASNKKHELTCLFTANAEQRSSKYK